MCIKHGMNGEEDEESDRRVIGWETVAPLSALVVIYDQQKRRQRL